MNDLVFQDNQDSIKLAEIFEVSVGKSSNGLLLLPKETEREREPTIAAAFPATCQPKPKVVTASSSSILSLSISGVDIPDKNNGLGLGLIDITRSINAENNIMVVKDSNGNRLEDHLEVKPDKISSKSILKSELIFSDHAQTEIDNNKLNGDSGNNNAVMVPLQLFSVGELVDVDPTAVPTFTKPAGTARITKFHTDGTYDVSFVLDGRTRKRVDTSIIFKSKIDLNSRQAPKRNPRSSKSNPIGNDENSERRKSEMSAGNKKAMHVIAASNKVSKSKFSAQQNSCILDRSEITSPIKRTRIKGGDPIPVARGIKPPNLESQYKELTRVLQKLEKLDHYAWYLPSETSGISETTKETHEVRNFQDLRIAIENFTYIADHEIKPDTDSWKSIISQKNDSDDNKNQEAIIVDGIVSQTGESMLYACTETSSVNKQVVSTDDITTKLEASELNESSETEKAKMEAALSEDDNNAKYIYVNWDRFRSDFTRMCQKNMGPDILTCEEKKDRGRISVESERILSLGLPLIDKSHQRMIKDVEEYLRCERLHKRKQIQQFEFLVPEPWRKDPYADRSYDPITTYVPASSLKEERDLKYIEESLRTHLDGHIGLPYNYDDTNLTSKWMDEYYSQLEDEGADQLPFKHTEESLIRAQVSSTMDRILQQVVIDIGNKIGALKNEPKKIGVHVEEKPVWGIDCYTKKSIEFALSGAPHPLSVPEIKLFIEGRLLKAINRQPVNSAHNMLNAIDDLVKNECKDSSCEIEALGVLRKAIIHLGQEHFRIHPKGTGAVCIDPDGIPANEFVTEYLGELYPAWTWCEKQEAIAEATRLLGLEPALPEFHNILLERPRADKDGYGLLFVDAGRRANLGGSLSHSCDSNCSTSVVARNGKLAIAICSDRRIENGEELTMDYFSFTASEQEHLAAVCLCGSSTCRGSFLEFSGFEGFQQIVDRNFGTLIRFTSLLNASVSSVPSYDHLELLNRHGIQKAAFVGDAPAWLQCYVADVLRFIEYERSVLPLELMKRKLNHMSGKGNPLSDWDPITADHDARSMMEHRIQSLVSVLSLIQHVLSFQKQHEGVNLDSTQMPPPLRLLNEEEVVTYLWNGTDSCSKKVMRGVLESISNDDKLRYSPKVIKIIATMQAMLNLNVNLLTKYECQEKLLKLRKELLKLKSCSGVLSSRHLAVADILLMLANTSTFVVAHKYEPVIGNPIQVLVHELGQPLQRERLNKIQNKIQNKLEDEPRLTNEDDCEATPSKRRKTNSTKILAESKKKRGNSIQEKSKSIEFCFPNEIAHTFRRTYKSDYIMSQLIQWHNDGQNTKSVELMGCTQLPDIALCYQNKNGSYSRKEQKTLLDIISDKFARIMPWPSDLKDAFEGPMLDKEKCTEVYGTPWLDARLDNSNGLKNVILALRDALKIEKTVESSSNNKDNIDNIVDSDDELAPKPPCQWVRCDHLLCQKWRRLPWNVDLGSLPENFFCKDNTWDPNRASCDMSEDEYDEAEEAVVNWGENKDHVPVNDIRTGKRFDVFCEVNRVYYEAVIKERKNDNVRIHFIKWNPKFDEWIPVNSDRIKPHHSRTKVTKAYINKKKQEIVKAKYFEDTL